MIRLAQKQRFDTINAKTGRLRLAIPYPHFSVTCIQSMADQPPLDTRRHQFLGKAIDLSANLTEAQLDGRACVRCGDEHSDKRPVEAWSEQSAKLFECVDAETCA